MRCIVLYLSPSARSKVPPTGHTPLSQHQDSRMDLNVTRRVSHRLPGTHSLEERTKGSVRDTARLSSRDPADTAGGQPSPQVPLLLVHQGRAGLAGECREEHLCASASATLRAFMIKMKTTGGGARYRRRKDSGLEVRGGGWGEKPTEAEASEKYSHYFLRLFCRKDP